MAVLRQMSGRVVAKMKRICGKIVASLWQNCYFVVAKNMAHTAAKNAAVFQLNVAVLWLNVADTVKMLRFNLNINCSKSIY